jgi:predicted amidohydrolase
MTCWEREFPEAARELMLAGAEVIIVPNATAWNPTRSHQLEARAFENMVAIASVNYPGDGWGQSSAYTPIVFDPRGRPLSALLAQADARPSMCRSVSTWTPCATGVTVRCGGRGIDVRRRITGSAGRASLRRGPWT